MCFGHASVENGETIAVPLSRRQWSQFAAAGVAKILILLENKLLSKASSSSGEK
jgi:hypothetical protein